MKIYAAHRTKDGLEVFVLDSAAGGKRHRLPLCLKIANHSPTGFECGYAGSGPAQLALALLVDVTGDPERALRSYQEFKRLFIANQPSKTSWSVSSTYIEELLQHLEASDGTVRDSERAQGGADDRAGSPGAGD